MSEQAGVNPDLAGRVYPAGAAYTVGREKIREFASAVKATHPAHFDVEAARSLGYADLVAPPTFAIIVAQRADAQLIEDAASISPGSSTPTSGSCTTGRSSPATNSWLSSMWTRSAPWAAGP
jgi:acyl dehydratase